MKRMLINATHTDEIRVAIADGQKLYDLDIDSAGHYRKKGNIYKAKVTRVEPSLEACFVNYGSERHGFLPYKEISPDYCKQAEPGQPRLPINEAIKEGDELIIQVNKEERGNKGAALSTYISLAGRYLVYMPGNYRAGGISRQIKGPKRAQLQNILDRLEIPKHDGVIVRTAGLGRIFEELHWDFTYLRQVWQAIQTTAKQKQAPFFIYQESDLFIRAIRDYLQPEIGEILIDDRPAYEKAREFMQQVMPHNLKKLSYYNDTTPLFSRYQIERQIQSAFEREVKLPSGGSLVIDHTEALLSIDINSARATKGIDVETTALNTNLEAADEIARQLRIRDLGGLIVIDFIDMRNHQNQREVEDRIKAATEIDRARVQIGKISRFGLLEMSRQRLRSSISDSSQITCPTCQGHGSIRSMESLIISIIRLTEEEMIKPKTGKIVIQLPPEISNKLLNEKRNELSDLEQRHKVQIAVISNDNLQSPSYHVQRLNTKEAQINIDQIELVKPEDCNKSIALDPPPPTRETAALQRIKPNVQAPKRSLILRLSAWFNSLFASDNKQVNRNKPKRQKYNNKNKQRPNNSKNQGNNRQQAKNQTNNKGKTARPQKNQAKTKSIYGNKNKQRPNNQKNQGKKTNQQQPNKNQGNKQQPKQNRKPNNKTAAQKPKNNPKTGSKTNPKNQAKQSIEVTKRMTRPLGSVADLAAKKGSIVPSGAKPNKNQAKSTEQPNNAAPNDGNQPKAAKKTNAAAKPKTTNKPASNKTQPKKPPKDSKAAVQKSTQEATQSPKKDHNQAPKTTKPKATQKPAAKPTPKKTTKKSAQPKPKTENSNKPKATAPKDNNKTSQTTKPKTDNKATAQPSKEQKKPTPPKND